MESEKIIRDTVLRHYPSAQGIYLFGSHGKEAERPDSDVDIALLLPHDVARSVGSLAVSDCRCELEEKLGRAVDLVNARIVSTVLQFQIVMTGRLIYRADTRELQVFEMLVMSFYQKLNEERREILEEFEKTGRAYTV